ncbi:hypothetical protein G7Y89_g9603 [Cudoniella acicularis]|uniref:Protein kinase domain-containing protein n=1 Tax=Cudoniella acicularis TaxID=354080 RepID=A0A8H4RGJ9_9HELO|nr:hypothetical protein G7Y89_g9603 [Cudoniella acicularis]
MLHPDQLGKSCETFMTYPKNIVRSTTPQHYLQQYYNRLSSHQDRIFCDDGKASLDIWEYDDDCGEFNPTCATSIFELIGRLQGVTLYDHVDPRCRFLFIHAPHSRDRLRTSKQMLAFALTYHQVMPVFLDFVFPFGLQEYPQDFHFSGFREETRLLPGDRGLEIPQLGRSGCEIRLCYSLKSVEASNNNPGSPWSMRQMAVCHSFDLETGKSFWVLVKGNNIIRDRIKDLTGPVSSSESELRSFRTTAGALNSSLATHELLCDWCGEEWRWYLNYLEKQLQETSQRALAVIAHHEPIFIEAPIQDIIIKKKPSALRIFSLSMKRTLISTFTKTFNQSNIEHDSTSLQPPFPYPSDLTRPIYGILHHHAVEANKAIAKRSQVSAERMEAMTEGMHSIAQKTKEETVSMRIITLVTLFFLPGTYVSQRDYEQPIQAFLAFLERSYAYEVVDNDANSSRLQEFMPMDRVKKYLEENRQRRLKQIIAVLCPGKESNDDILPSDILPNYVAVFCTLLQISKGIWITHFRRYDSLRDVALPFNPQHPPANWPANAGEPNFLQTFCDQQMRFCVPTLQRSMSEKHFEPDRVLPIIFKETLATGGSARLWMIRLYPSYNKLLLNDSTPNLGVLPTDTFVLKTYFTSDAKVYYDNEVTAFRRLGSNPNIIGFCGSFIRGKTFNVLLEYADKGTLEQFFKREKVPTDGGEVIQFWERMFKVIDALECIHEVVPSLPNGPQIFQGWHQDVKPTNILVISHGSTYRFKLADLGISHFKRKISPRQEFTSSDIQGTRTYGAPECYRPYDPAAHDRLKINQDVDIWSLGCIFSEAARWLAHGFQGVNDYRQERRIETSRIPGFRDADCFHNGESLLQAVLNSHEKTQPNLQRADFITQAVIEQMINPMLEVSGGRPSAKVLRHTSCRLLRKATEAFQAFSFRQGAVASSARVRPLPPVMPPSFPPSRAAGIGSLIDYKLDRLPEDKDELYRDSTVYLMNERDELKSQYIEEIADSSAEGGKRFIKRPRLLPMVPGHIPSSFSSERSLRVSRSTDSSSPVKNSEQSEYQNFQPVSSGVKRPKMQHIEQKFHDSLSASKLSNGDMIRQGSNDWHLHNMEMTDNHTQRPFTLDPINPLRSRPQEIFPLPICRPSSTEKNANLSAHGQQNDQTNFIIGIEPSSPCSTDPQTNLHFRQHDIISLSPLQSMSTFLAVPEDSPCSENAERQGCKYISIEKMLEWKRHRKEEALFNRVLSFAKRKQIPACDLQMRLKGRDHVFLVDDSRSMRVHWGRVQQVIEALSYAVKETGDNGVDLLFAASEKRLLHCKSTRKLVSLVKSRENDEEDNIGRTDINIRLIEIFDEYKANLDKTRSKFCLHPKQVRPRTLYILTDGVWEEACNPASLIEGLVTRLHRSERDRWQFGIQFISFGKDRVGLDRLERLDSLNEELNLPLDIVDTEPSVGNAWKMLLGAINDTWDKINDPKRQSVSTVGRNANDIYTTDDA